MIVIDVKFVPAGMNDWLPLPINREAFLRALTAHASIKTTKLYDRRGDVLTLDEVERIAI